MSEKVTFKELIESIAKETDHSRQFTHDFFKDFVDIIHDGLEKDGKVNIAGFGKFKLTHVDEQEGYNPQTEEKMTIPAHNKIVFKPYKDFRELINAPYAHRELELIEEDDKLPEETASTEEQSQQEDFIPTGPTTQHDSKPAENVEQDTENEDKDVVEFNADQQEPDEENDELDEYIGDTQADHDNKQADNDYDQQEQNSETESTTSEPEIAQQSADVDEHPTPSPTFGEHSSGRRNTTSIPMGVVAAAFILLLAIGSALYFSAFSTDESPQMSAPQSVQNTGDTEQQIDQQEQNQGGGNKNSTNSTKQPADNQNKQTAQSSATATVSASSQTSEEASAVDNNVESTNIQQGQTLWSIAEDTYGNPRLWPWIYGTNDRLQDPNKILAGNALSVPLPSGPQNSLTTADSIGVAKGFLATYHWYENQNSSKAKNHLWGAKVYHDNLRNIADIKINKADLKFANRAR